MFSISVISNKLKRKYMEDTYYINKSKNFLCISDGHGGKFTSDYICNNFFKELKKNIKNIIETDEPSKLKKVFYKICKNIDLNLYETIQIFKKDDISGATFSTIFIIDEYIYFLNIGDSITSLILNGQIYYMNKIHKPEDEKEKQRIEKNYFVFENRINGRLNISRTFGDFNYKNMSDYYNSAVIAKPSLYRINIKEIKSKNSWVILASDGIYEKYPINLIIEVIDYFLKIGFNTTLISKLILSHYKYINIKDNLTFIIALLDKIKINYEDQIFFNKFLDFHKNFIKNDIKFFKHDKKSVKNYYSLYIKILNIPDKFKLILFFLENFILNGEM